MYGSEQTIWISAGGRRRWIASVMAATCAFALWGGGAHAAGGGVKASVPVAAIPVWRSAPRYPGVSRVPTVVVPAIRAVDNPPIPGAVPTSVAMHVPPRVAQHLAAYVIPLSGGDSTIILGPRGMTGSVEIGADSSEGVRLHDGLATLTLGTAGPSPLIAAGQESTLFPSAWKASRAMLGMHSTWTPKDRIHPATIRYQDGGQVAAYAFQNAGGQEVYGLGVYAGASSGGNALKVFGSNALTLQYVGRGSDAALAPWIMDAAEQMVLNPLTGTVSGEHPVRIRVGSRVYRLAVPDGTTATGLWQPAADGIVWVAEPVWIRTVSGTWVPAGSFTIAVAPDGGSRLTLYGTDAASRVVLEVSPWEFTAGSSAAPQQRVSLLGTVDRQWLLYQVRQAGLGAATAGSRVISAVDLSAGSSERLVVLVHDSGVAKRTVLMGSAGAEVVWDIFSGRRSGAGVLEAVNLVSGVRRHLPAAMLHGRTIRFRMAGHLVTVTLHPMGNG